MSTSEHPKPPQCEGCPLYNMPGPVFGEGDPNAAQIVYIGRNPSAEEVKEYRPFIGPSGRILNRQLFESGIGRHELYITNQVKCLTPGNRAPTELEVAKCRPLLDAELRRCKADTVILAGKTAFDAHLRDYSTIPGYRPRDKKGQPVSHMTRMGCVELKAGRKWIGTIHPAFIMRMPMFHDAPIIHLKKAMAIAGIPLTPPKVLKNPSASEVKDYADHVRTTKRFADDVETEQKLWQYNIDEDDFIGSDYRLDTIGVSPADNVAFVLPPNRASEWFDIWRDSNIIQFEQNGEYDRYYLEPLCPQENIRFDTMLAHHWLHNTMRHALKPHVVSMYTNLPYYHRDLGKMDADLYNGLDCIATLIAGKAMERRMREL